MPRVKPYTVNPYTVNPSHPNPALVPSQPHAPQQTTLPLQVVIGPGLLDDWPAMQRWTKSSLLQQYAGVQ